MSAEVASRDRKVPTFPAWSQLDKMSGMSNCYGKVLSSPFEILEGQLGYQKQTTGIPHACTKRHDMHGWNHTYLDIHGWNLVFQQWYDMTTFLFNIFDISSEKWIDNEFWHHFFLLGYLHEKDILLLGLVCKNAHLSYLPSMTNKFTKQRVHLLSPYLACVALVLVTELIFSWQLVSTNESLVKIRY